MLQKARQRKLLSSARHRRWLICLVVILIEPPGAVRSPAPPALTHPASPLSSPCSTPIRTIKEIFCLPLLKAKLPREKFPLRDTPSLAANAGESSWISPITTYSHHKRRCPTRVPNTPAKIFLALPFVVCGLLGPALLLKTHVPAPYFLCVLCTAIVEIVRRPRSEQNQRLFTPAQARQSRKSEIRNKSQKMENGEY